MLKRFLPQEEGFFQLFQKAAELIVESSKQFHAMLQDLKNYHPYVIKIATIEEEGDAIAHKTFELLHKTFITPFDRHDINQLTSGLDDVLDLLNRCAQRFPYYQLQTVPSELIQLSELGVQASIALKHAIERLSSLKHADMLFKFCEEIDLVESKAHQVVLVGERKLFLEEDDFKQFFKLKEIYSQTKMVINHCQDVGNIIKGIILEYS